MLLLVLQQPGAALSSFEVFALIGLASLAAVVSLALRFDRAPMRLAGSVNDNQPGRSRRVLSSLMRSAAADQLFGASVCSAVSLIF